MLRSRRETSTGTARYGESAALVLISAAALVFDVTLYYKLGWRTGGDTFRYVDGARRLLSGQPLSERQLGYVAYIGGLAIAEWFHLGVLPIYLFQLGLSWLAGLAAFGLGNRLSGWRAGLLCGLFWVAFFDIQRWNYYLLTDGPFLSLVMICCWLVIRAPSTGWGGLALASAAVACMALLRINGVFFAIFFAAYLFVGLSSASRRSALAAAMLAMALLLPVSGQLFSFVARSADGVVVRQGVYEFLLEGQVIWDTVSIKMPPPSSSTSGPRDLAVYIVENPGSVATVYALRLRHFLFAYNPRYSRAHIVVNYLAWTMLYVLATVGVLSVVRRSAWHGALACVWLCQALLVMLTVGDYDGRYSLYGAPAILPFAAVGCDAGITKLSSALRGNRA